MVRGRILVLLAVLFYFLGCETTDKVITDEKTADTSKQTEKALESYLEDGNPQEALQYMKKLDKDKMTSDDVAVYSSMLIAAGEYDEAKSIAEISLEKDPDNLDVLYNLAILAQGQGDFDAYENYLQKMLDINPKDSRANSGLGMLSLQKGESDDAKQYFSNALEQQEDFLALNGMGKISLMDQEYEKALDWFSRAISMDEKNSYVYSDRSKANMGLEKYISAEKDLNKAVELDPGYVWHYVDRGRLRFRKMRKEKGAVDDFCKALELDPENFFALAYRGQILEEWGDLDQAYEDLKKTLLLQPDYYPVFPSYGFLSYYVGEYEQAIEYFDLVRQDYPTEYSTFLMKALSLKKLGKEREARQFLEQNIRFIPRDNPFYEMARFYINPRQDFTIMNAVQKIEKQAVRQRFLFYLASQYELISMESIANKYYQEIADESLIGFPEIRIAKQIWADKNS